MTRRSLLLVFIAAALLWFLPLNAPGLYHPDEGRYGEIPREMLSSGDWVTPRLDAIKYFEKPPLQYWMTAAAFEAFGQHEWTVRLWSALTGFAGVLLTGWLGRRIFDTRTGLCAAAVQAGALLYAALARLAVLDMGLTFTLQLALTALVLLVHPPPATTPTMTAATQVTNAAAPVQRWAPLLLGVGLALALLAKGLVGILIPCAVAGIYLLLYRDWGLFRRSQPWWSVVALVVIAAPWFVLVSRSNPEFPHFFFWREHFQRYLTKIDERYEPVWFFVPILLLGLLPWLGLLPRALAQAWRASRRGHRATAMLLIWAGFILVFFSLSDSKLIPYILPLFPALALLMGRTLAQLSIARLRRQAAVLALALVGGVALILLIWLLPATASIAARATAPLVAGLVAALLALALGAGVAVVFSQRRQFGPAVAAMALGGIAMAQIALIAGGQLPQMRAMAQLRDTAQPLLGPDTAFYCVGTYPQPLPFYLRRTCTLVGYRGELDFGLTQEPRRAIASLESFAVRWRAQTDAFAVISPQAYTRLIALGTPMHVIYTSPSLIGMIRQ